MSYYTIHKRKLESPITQIRITYHIRIFLQRSIIQMKEDK
jgi:hypothetical protein